MGRNWQLRAERIRLGLTQSEAADTVYSGLRAWQRWEAGQQPMPPAKAALWRQVVKAILLDDKRERG